jgi:hypothetical protein
MLCVGWAVATAAVKEIEPNDATPQAVGALSKPSTTILVDGTSGYAGDIDWFSFEVGGSGSQAIRLATESDVSWQIVLYADNLAHIVSGADSLTRDLAPGRYRVRIQQSDLGTGSYVFVISNALEHESNDGLMEATSLGTLGSEPLTAFASISPAGDVDFFSFDVPEDFATGLAPGMSRIVRIETPCRRATRFFSSTPRTRRSNALCRSRATTIRAPGRGADCTSSNPSPAITRCACTSTRTTRRSARIALSSRR